MTDKYRNLSTADLKRIERGRANYLSELFQELESMDQDAPENAERVRKLIALIDEYETYSVEHYRELDRRAQKKADTDE